MSGQGRVFQRGVTLWIAYYCRGREHRESANTDDRKKAERFLKLRIKEVGADAIGAKPFAGPQAERVTVGKLLDALEADLRLRGKLSDKTQSNIKPLREHFGEMRANQVLADTLTSYIESLLAESYSPATVNRRTQLLGQAYKLAVRHRKLTQMPFITRRSEVGNERQGFFERGDFIRVLENLREHLQDFCRFDYICGWRKGAVAGLTWADVGPDVVYLRPSNNKARKPESIPLFGELGEVIERRRDARNGKFVFHREGKPIGDFRKSWATACRMAGVSERLFHDFRRTASRNLVRAGVPVPVAMKITGHRTETTFRRYAIVNEAQKAEALRAVAEYQEADERKQAQTGTGTIQ